MKEVSPESGPRTRTRVFARGQGALSVLMILLVGLGIASVVIRSHRVMGGWVAERIEAVAAERGVRIGVHTMGPAGLTGLRLYGVVLAGEARGSGYVVEAHSVDVYPSLRGWLAGGDRLAEVLIRQGRVRLSPGSGREAAEAVEGATRVVSAQESLANTLILGCHDCSIEVDPGLLAGWSDEAERIDLPTIQARIVRSEQGWDLRALEGSLRRAGQAPWTLSLTESVPGQRRVRLEGEGLSTAGLGFELPGGASMGVGYIELDWDGSRNGTTRRVVMGEVFIDAGRLSEIGLRHGLIDASIEEGIARVTLARGLIWSRDASRALAEIEESTFVFDEREGTLSARAVAKDRGTGRVDLSGRWHLVDERVTFEAWFADFDTGPLLRRLPSHSVVKGLRLGGTVSGEMVPGLGLAEVVSGLELRELLLDLPFLATEVLVFDRVGLSGTTLIHLPSKSVSLTQAELRVGQARGLSLEATAVSAEPGWVFSAQVRGEGIESGALLDALPPAMTGALTEARLEGAFDVLLKTSGHTGYPDSLVLDVGFTGDVEVKRDGHVIDVRALGSGAMPAFDSESHRARRLDASRWVRYEDLPIHVSRALLSAEDASFFEHSGLDWVGLRMAMVHNLRAGQFERGGSTISQQLAKNLFLTPNRTLSRKLQEAFLTWRIEAELDKERILELYLNVVEWGSEVHGLHRAAYHYFGVHPHELEPVEMVLLASILPNPIRFGDAVKQGYLPSSRRGKMERVLVNMRFLDHLSWEAYFKAQRALEAGRVGRITLKPCADDDTAPTDAPACADVIAHDGDLMDFEAWEVTDIPVETGWVPLTHDFQP
jgi:penicillin-binding protein 1A